MTMMMMAIVGGNDDSLCMFINDPNMQDFWVHNDEKFPSIPSFSRSHTKTWLRSMLLRSINFVVVHARKTQQFSQISRYKFSCFPEKKKIQHI